MRTELDAQLERLHAAQAELAALRVVASSPDGSVSAVAEARAAADRRPRALTHLAPGLRLVR